MTERRSQEDRVGVSQASATPPQPASPDVAWIADELEEEMKRLNALMKAGQKSAPAMTIYTHLNSLRNRIQAAATQAKAAQPAQAMAAARELLFRSRVADLLRLLELAVISTPNPIDAHKAHFIAESLRSEVKSVTVLHPTPAPAAVQEPEAGK